MFWDTLGDNCRPKTCWLNLRQNYDSIGHNKNLLRKMGGGGGGGGGGGVTVRSTRPVMVTNKTCAVAVQLHPVKSSSPMA